MNMETGNYGDKGDLGYARAFFLLRLKGLVIPTQVVEYLRCPSASFAPLATDARHLGLDLLLRVA